MTYDQHRYHELTFDTFDDLAKLSENPEIFFNYYDLDRAARLKLYDCFHHIYYKIADLDHIYDYGLRVKNLDITLVQWLSVRNQLNNYLYYKIIQEGLPETAIYVLEKYKFDPQSVLDSVCSNCSVEVLKWLIEHGAILSQQQIDSRWDIPGFEYIMTLDKIPSENALMGVVNEPEVFNWLWNKGITTTDKDVAYRAMHYSKFEVIKRLVEHGCFPKFTGELDCKVDNIMDIMIWLEDKGIHPSDVTAARAYLANNIELLEWLAKRGVLPNMQYLEVEDYSPRGLYQETREWRRNNKHLELPYDEQVKKCTEYRTMRTLQS